MTDQELAAASESQKKVQTLRRVQETLRKSTDGTTLYQVGNNQSSFSPDQQKILVLMARTFIAENLAASESEYASL